MHKIKEGALFIADAHYPHHGDELLHLLQHLESGKIVTPQLFLMGDIFDLLFGYNDYIRHFSSEATALLQRLSQKMEIYYFEGNHDFLLKSIFKNINIYPRSMQPLFFDLNGQKIGLAHGDKFALGTLYDLYCFLLRNRWLIKVLKPLDRMIIDDRIARLKRKNICHPMKDFEKRAEEIVTLYPDVDLVIEGHYHQGKRIGSYLSLPSLSCQKQVAVAREGKIVFVEVDALLL